MKKNIPVIILNWNGKADTLKSVESILNQSIQNFHIFLADNNSDNEEGVFFKDYFAANQKITVILYDSNLGFAKAHNNIFEDYIFKGDYDYVALLNNDAFANKNWLESLLLRTSNPNVGMIASKMINFFYPEQMDNAGHLLLNTAEVLPIGHGDKIELHNEAKQNFGACAGATLYKVAMLKEIGIFDNYFLTGYEDAELGMRANLFGYETWYEPKAVVHHKISQSLKKVKDFNYLVYIQKSIFYSYYKLMPLPVLILNTLIIIFKYIAVIIFNLFTRRFDFIKLIAVASYEFIKEFDKVKKARKELHKKKFNFRSISLMKKMHFFLLVDFKRAFKFIVPNTPTFFESYKKA